MSEVPVRDVILSDAAVLAALHGVCFDRGWSVESMQTCLAAPGTFGLIAGHDLALGMVLARLSAGEAEILTICVHPDNRGVGVGRLLLDRAAALARDQGGKRLFLEVAARNAAAGALYRSANFRQIGKRANYYPAETSDDMPDDALLYVRELE